ncbi:nucleoside deaminase [Gammaproteobacteria bacterium]|nr:nucleoside deaminase [Gammaproteobacteria bacterium]
MSTELMQYALLEAKRAESKGEVPIGAVITFQSKIIASSHNQTITLTDATAHAEICCIQEASRILKNHRLIDCELFVTLEPCLMCIGAICQARIKKVHFGAYDHRSGFLSNQHTTKALNLNWHPEFIGGVLELECKALLQQFFQARR